MGFRTIQRFAFRVARHSCTEYNSQHFTIGFIQILIIDLVSITCTKMIRQDFNRIDPKRRSTIDHKKKQFATALYKQQEYPHRLNIYETPPTAEITLEQFEQWAIDRLRSIVDSNSFMRIFY